MSGQIIGCDLEEAILDEVDYLSDISCVGSHSKCSFKDIDGAIERTTLAAH
jgi:hypothetical protein